MKVRLTRKFADFLDGIDLSRDQTGDTIDLTPREAQLLVAEGWAVAVDDEDTASNSVETADDVVRPFRRSVKRRA